MPSTWAPAARSARRFRRRCRRWRSGPRRQPPGRLRPAGPRRGCPGRGPWRRSAHSPSAGPAGGRRSPRGDARGGGAHQHLAVGEMLADEGGDALRDARADGGIGQGQPVVAVDGGLDAAGPCKGCSGRRNTALTLKRASLAMAFFIGFLLQIRARSADRLPPGRGRR